MRKAFAARSYAPMSLNIGSVTDAYQPAERKLGNSRQVLQVCRDFRHPFSLITKSAGVERDIDLIAADPRSPMTKGRSGGPGSGG